MLDQDNHFDNTGNMETKTIIAALSALAQESRLSIFRLLVETGPEGLPVGVIAETLGLANATLSFHLKELTHAGLTTAAPNGRSIIYSANFTTMMSLIDYLTENCCAGAGCAPCLPPEKSIAQKKSSTTHRRKS
jgi:ArsR family transcriptional regulator, arsenate/arsenite/antimonite-responsive transcriptional repressor